MRSAGDEQCMRKINSEVLTAQQRIQADLQALADELRARKSSEEHLKEAVSKFRSALEQEIRDRSAFDLKLEEQLRALQLSDEERFNQVSDALDSLRAQIVDNETLTSTRNELGAFEVHLRSLDSTMTFMREEIAHEAEAREAADKECSRQLAAWTCKDSQNLLNVERAERESDLQQVRDEVNRLKGSLRTMEDESSRLWEAIDTHTHDVNIDTQDEQTISKKWADIKQWSAGSSIVQSTSNVDDSVMSGKLSIKSPVMVASQLVNTSALGSGQTQRIAQRSVSTGATSQRQSPNTSSYIGDTSQANNVLAIGSIARMVTPPVTERVVQAVLPTRVAVKDETEEPLQTFRFQAPSRVASRRD